MVPPTLDFFLKITKAIWCLFWFHINFWSICSRSLKYAFRILIRIALNLQIGLCSMYILMMLILPIHECGICFHLFVSSSISFYSVLQFSKCRSFTSLVKFIPRYFCCCCCCYRKQDFFHIYSFLVFTVCVQKCLSLIHI